jgi:hypothetical protein
MMNPDIDFALSTSALRKLHADATALGLTTAKTFRKKAFALSRDTAPQFDLSGEEPSRVYHVGVHEGVMRGLGHVAQRMGVSKETIGELVACYEMPEGAA